ncbi:MAG: hypothetical protein PHD04_05295 [Candidatus Pacebacteria bacterium]|nr:hypothetical protein [Candidatus Paceibacterota bacterium]
MIFKQKIKTKNEITLVLEQGKIKVLITYPKKSRLKQRLALLNKLKELLFEI